MTRFFSLFLFFSSFLSFAQETAVTFQKGESLKYRIHYGIVNAGYATLKVNETKKQHHFIGHGWTIGMASWFFKVEDTYESYVDKTGDYPTHFVRKVNEGGYKINRDIYFDHENNKAKVKDHRKKTEKEYEVENVYDLISAFYNLRNSPIDTMTVGTSVKMDLFIDAEVFAFKLVLMGKETITSKFGKIPCYKFRPYVQSGRVFKERESLTIWVSADKNKIPVRVKASLAVGSLKMDLTSYKGLSYPFPKK